MQAFLISFSSPCIFLDCSSDSKVLALLSQRARPLAGCQYQQCPGRPGQSSGGSLSVAVQSQPGRLRVNHDAHWQASLSDTRRLSLCEAFGRAGGPAERRVTGMPVNSLGFVICFKVFRSRRSNHPLRRPLLAGQKRLNRMHSAMPTWLHITNSETFRRQVAFINNYYFQLYCCTSRRDINECSISCLLVCSPTLFLLMLVQSSTTVAAARTTAWAELKQDARLQPLFLLQSRPRGTWPQIRRNWLRKRSLSSQAPSSTTVAAARTTVWEAPRPAAQHLPRSHRPNLRPGTAPTPRSLRERKLRPLLSRSTAELNSITAGRARTTASAAPSRAASPASLRRQSSSTTRPKWASSPCRSPPPPPLPMPSKRCGRVWDTCTTSALL